MPSKKKRGPMEYIQTIQNNYFDNSKKINPVTRGKKLFTQRQQMYKQSNNEIDLFVTLYIFLNNHLIEKGKKKEAILKQDFRIPDCNFVINFFTNNLINYFLKLNFLKTFINIFNLKNKIANFMGQNI